MSAISHESTLLSDHCHAAAFMLMRIVYSRFLQPPRQTKIGSRIRGYIRDKFIRGKKNGSTIRGNIREEFIEGKRKLVREVRRFGKSRVREIGILLYNLLHYRTISFTLLFFWKNVEKFG